MYLDISFLRPNKASHLVSFTSKILHVTFVLVLHLDIAHTHEDQGDRAESIDSCQLTRAQFVPATSAVGQPSIS
jgi:hypothetical protein